jgi:transcription elongation factor SPT5
VCDIQVSSEVTTGLNTLGEYNLYDLVMVNANECGVVIMIGLDTLKIVTHQDIVKTVSPLQLRGKKNNYSLQNVSAFDHLYHPLKSGDTVNVVEGTYIRKSGTIKHINKNILFLHSTTQMKNSGIFVVKAKSCILAGSNVKESTDTATTLLKASLTGGSKASVDARLKSVMKRGGQRDENIGKTVKIIKGGYKGVAATIMSSSDTHYTIELLTKVKQLVIEKDKVQLVGDKNGLFNAAGEGTSGGFGMMINTPALIADTPGMGAETPLHAAGSETPLYPAGSRTPGTPGRSDDTYDMWKPNAQDRIDNSRNTFGKSPHASELYDGRTPRSNNDIWGNTSSYDQSSPQSGWGNQQTWNSSSKSSVSSKTEGWGDDMVVVLQTGTNEGLMGIICGSLDSVSYIWQISITLLLLLLTCVLYVQDDSFMCMIRSVKAARSGPPFRVRAADVTLAPPQKKDTVRVLNGAYKGKRGKVKVMHCY